MADMNTERNDIESLFARSRRTEPGIPDDGFVAGVMARLPAARRLSDRQRDTILLAATGLGSAAAAARFWFVIDSGWVEIVGQNWLALPVTGAVLTYAVAAVAIWSVNRQ